MYGDLLTEKLKYYFGDMLVYKSPEHSKCFSALTIPSFMRDWLVMRFSDEEGHLKRGKVSEYTARVLPKKEQWNLLLADMMYGNQTVRFLAKVRIDLDTRSRKALFSLPDFDFPTKKGDAVADWRVIDQNRDTLLAPNETWGIVEIACLEKKDGKGSEFCLTGFTPFCPYVIDLSYYVRSREHFTTEEWIDVLLGAVDYHPRGYDNIRQKMAMLKRLLPFVEKRINLIELAPKETGKSYVFAQISKYGWLVSGGSISRPKMFYDITRRTHGLVSHYDYVALDEIQSIRFADEMEMRGALKGYLETGEYRVGDHRGVGEAGLVLLGNIQSEYMDVERNMFGELPKFFHESALLDRFHGFIKGWELPKMKESLKADGWALNTEYFGEILHLLRSEACYRAVVDRLLELPKDASTRDTEAIKRLCTGFLKLIFPHVTDVSKVNAEEFRQYCLEPALEMRGIIKHQLGILDPGEFGQLTIPDIRLKPEFRTAPEEDDTVPDSDGPDFPTGGMSEVVSGNSDDPAGDDVVPDEPTVDDQSESVEQSESVTDQSSDEESEKSEDSELSNEVLEITEV